MTSKTKTDSTANWYSSRPYVKPYKFRAKFSKECRSLTRMSGVYSFWRGSTLEYIGVSTNLAQRIRSSYKEKYPIYTRNISMRYILANESDSQIIETYLICLLQPKINKTGKYKEKPTIIVEYPQWSDKFSVSEGDV